MENIFYDPLMPQGRILFTEREVFSIYEVVSRIVASRAHDDRHSCSVLIAEQEWSQYQCEQQSYEMICEFLVYGEEYPVVAWAQQGQRALYRTLDLAAKSNFWSGATMLSLFPLRPEWDADGLAIRDIQKSECVRALCIVNADRVPPNPVIAAIAQTMALLNPGMEKPFQNFLEERPADELSAAKEVRDVFSNGEPGFSAWLSHGVEAWDYLQE